MAIKSCNYFYSIAYVLLLHAAATFVILIITSNGRKQIKN